MTSPQPIVRLGSMETVFPVLLIVIGLYLLASLAQILLVFIWVVIPILLTLALISAVVYALWRFARV